MLILENALALWLTNLFLINFEFTYDMKGVGSRWLSFTLRQRKHSSACVTEELSSPSEIRKT